MRRTFLMIACMLAVLALISSPASAQCANGSCKLPSASGYLEGAFALPVVPVVPAVPLLPAPSAYTESSYESYRSGFGSGYTSSYYSESFSGALPRGRARLFRGGLPRLFRGCGG